MQGDNYLDSTESEEELNRVLEASVRDVSLSSIRTQDSIDSTENRAGEAEENKDAPTETAGENSHNWLAVAHISLKEAQTAVRDAFAAPRIRLAFRSLSEIRNSLQKQSEDFQAWKKQSDCYS
jgi:hypothetical protein